jgi:hypothetical protein
VNAGASITKWLLMMLMLFALACAGCVPSVEPYGADELVYLRATEPAPFDGWLLSDADLEALIKAAHEAP